MRDHDDRARPVVASDVDPRLLQQCACDAGSVTHVLPGRGFVEQDDRLVAAQRAGEQNPLLCAHVEVGAPDTRRRVQTAGQHPRLVWV